MGHLGNTEEDLAMTTNAKLFSEQGHSQYTRAVQCWQLLVAAARQHRIVTYAGLSREMGMDENALPVVGTNALNLIGQFCTDSGLPQLTRIVVGQNTGLPGPNTPEVVRAENIWSVFSFDWLDVIPPTAEDLLETSR